MPIEGNNFKDELSARFIEMMDSERGLQTKLADSIGKSPSFFSGLKQGKPVNALHLKAASIVFGPLKLLELMAIEGIWPEGDGNPSPLMQIGERRKIPQNQREGIISNFEDKETAREAMLALAEIEILDRAHFMLLAGEIKGTARALKPKKKA